MPARTTPTPVGRAAPRLALPWIVRLRYAMALGQILTVLIVDRVLRIDLPLAWVFVPPALVIFSNWWVANRAATGRSGGGLADSTLIAGVFVLDTLCLTAVLMLTGGPNNPFSLLYLVHITLSATILTRRQTWALGLLAALCFALLFWRYRPIAALEMHPHGDGTSLHLVGMWVGFAVASLLVALFSGKISELLREREESLFRLQEELARRDRLASLVTLAAGAAHELSTPLATIAVVARELERCSAAPVRYAAIADDSRLIRMEVDRCREILQRMSMQGAEPAGEAIERLRAGVLLDSVQSAFRGLPTLRVEAAPGCTGRMVSIPRHAVEQALIALVKNALEASPAKTPVVMAASHTSDALRFTVKDSGTGIPGESLRHIGEPFYTTKEPGKGMGLGIFLVRTLAERLGGRFEIDSAPGEGTTATLEIPAADVGAAAPESPAPVP